MGMLEASPHRFVELLPDSAVTGSMPASPTPRLSPVPSSPDDESRVPDLLHSRPLTRIDLPKTKLAVALAFASGVSGGLFAEALEGATLAPSTWDPGSFAKDLFLPTFVSLCYRVRIGTYEPPLVTSALVRLLGSPPTDPEVVSFRRSILDELAGADHELRRELERLYLALCRLRSLLEGATGAGKWDRNRRQLDILGVVQEIIEGMSRGFAGAESGLSRLASFGRRVKASEPYRSLVDLLRYDERLGTLDLKVSVGADGRIRGFEIAALQENVDNPFVSSPLRRWLAKVELFLRGYNFGDGEVMARLIDAVWEGVEDDIVRLVQLLGDLEFYLGALAFRDLASNAGLEVSLPEIVAPGDTRTLRGLWNPLLLGTGTRVVPCDVTWDRHDATLLVTGPNSGGKTRLLQTLGLTQMLGQSGVFVPAAAATIASCPALVVSLIEEARPDQTEGRLGTELVRIRSLFERLAPGSMVILDELCSGTNPSEGEEIFELVMRMLSRLRPQALVTTHFLSFAARLEREGSLGDLRFLQVELGPEQRPTYQFTGGVARTSLAGQAARRLGVTGEQLMSLIDRNISSAALG
jgi:DNA mismatch repair protein MutS2